MTLFPSDQFKPESHYKTIEIETSYDHVTATPSCRDCSGVFEYAAVMMMVVVAVMVMVVMMVGSARSRSCGMRLGAVAARGMADTPDRAHDQK